MTQESFKSFINMYIGEGPTNEDEVSGANARKVVLIFGSVYGAVPW